jgi:hypothetical protein
MTAVDKDFAVRVATAVRSAAVVAARGPAHDLARGGHDASARAHNNAASDVARIDLEAIIAAVAELAPDMTEQAAFTKAARASMFDCARHADGTFYYPITGRAHAIWLAAVRWARLNPESPP